MHTLPQLKVVQTDNHTGKKAPTQNYNPLQRHVDTQTHKKIHLSLQKTPKQTNIHLQKQTEIHTYNKQTRRGRPC